jgi:limonene-1,2-epoxide hydrolase
MTTPSDFVEDYLSTSGAFIEDLDRLRTSSSGLDGDGILAVISDPRLEPVVLDALVDLMHPQDSFYYDAIYGGFHGQRAIRNWLIPTMAEISFVEFVPTAATETFSDGEGRVTSSVDEWQMFANIDGERLPLPRGVSVRHYAGGWIMWNADVYDTGAFRLPGPDGETVPLPAPPRTAWDASRSEPWEGVLDNLHQDVVYHDPLFGTFEGADAVRAWLDDVMPKIGNVRHDVIGPVLVNDSCTVREWVQVGVGDDGSTMAMFRGTSVHRFADGALIYAADYFDTAELADPDVLVGSRLAGSTLTAADIARYREPQ